MRTKREPVPVDLWLWAARLVQTRAQAAEAVAAGRVHVNGALLSDAAAPVKPGDAIELVVGDARIAVDVRGTARLRGPERIAQQLYAESVERDDDADEDALARRAAVPRVSAGAAGAAATRTKAGRRAAEDAANSRRVAPRGGGKLGR